MNVRLHIERLILDGLPVDAAQGPVVQAAVEAELARLLAEGGIAPTLLQGGMLAYARGTDLHRVSALAPDALGREIARSAHNGIRP